MKAHFSVTCRRPAAVLNRLTRAGISVDRLEWGEGKFAFRTSARESGRAASVLSEAGVEYEVTGFLGARVFLRRLFSRPFLAFSLLLSVLAVAFFGGFVYDVSIRGNRYVNTSQIRSVLSAHHVDGFTAKSELDLPRIKREIGAIDGISFASVKVVGTRLEVEVKESLPLTLPDPSDFVPILSSHSAVVTRVVAESGTPRVSSGDRVERGALLIEPIYAFTEGGAPAPARGEVWGVVTHVREIVLPSITVESMRTGNRISRRSVTFFGKEMQPADPPPFDEYELSERVIYRGFGVTVTERTYAEVCRGVLYHDFDLEGRQALRGGITDLLLSVPCDAIPRGDVRATQKILDNMLYIVIYYTVEQRIDSLSLVPQ